MVASQIVSAGHSLYVEQWGPADGSPVILLHHGLGSTRAWKSQTKNFSKAGFRVIAYDRWGYGKSDPRPKLSMPFFDEDLVDLVCLLDHLDISKASLVGHSDGGTIALYFAAQYPERMKGLVTLAAHIYIEEVMIYSADKVYQDYLKDTDFQRRLRRSHGDKTENLVAFWYHGWHRPENLGWDMRSELGKITCPSLIIQGMKDEHATPNHAIDLAQSIPNAVLCMFPNAGHMLQRENSVEFNHRVLDFLERSANQESVNVQ